jgi:hypothetical protein
VIRRKQEDEQEDYNIERKGMIYWCGKDDVDVNMGLSKGTVPGR